MSDEDTLGLEVATLDALHKAIGKELNAARARNQAEMNARYKDSKADRIAVTLPDGTKVATATLTIPEATCTVSTDGELDYLEYVRDNHPGEVELVPATVRVRTAFRKNHLESLRVVDGKAIDPATGEIVPGVQVIPAGEPTSFRLNFTKYGRNAIAEAWQRGDLADVIHFTPPAIEPGDEP